MEYTRPRKAYTLHRDDVTACVQWHLLADQPSNRDQWFLHTPLEFMGFQTLISEYLYELLYQAVIDRGQPSEAAWSIIDKLADRASKECLQNEARFESEFARQRIAQQQEQEQAQGDDYEDEGEDEDEERQRPLDGIDVLEKVYAPHIRGLRSVLRGALANHLEAELMVRRWIMGTVLYRVMDTDAFRKEQVLATSSWTEFWIHTSAQLHFKANYETMPGAAPLNFQWCKDLITRGIFHPPPLVAPIQSDVDSCVRRYRGRYDQGVHTFVRPHSPSDG
jgi:hypothetical protein